MIEWWESIMLSELETTSDNRRDARTARDPSQAEVLMLRRLMYSAAIVVLVATGCATNIPEVPKISDSGSS